MVRAVLLSACAATAFGQQPAGQPENTVPLVQPGAPGQPTKTLTKSVAKFVSSTDDNIVIHVRNVSIEDLRTPPYKATVDFDQVYEAVGTGLETHREKYSAHFVFGLADHVSNNFVPINPLGLIISYFRDDQAF